MSLFFFNDLGNFLSPPFSFLKIILFILALLGFHCCVGFSLVTASRVYPLVVVCGLFIALASLEAEFRL